MRKEFVQSITNTLVNMNKAEQLVFDVSDENNNVIQLDELNTIDEKLCKINQVNIYVKIDERYSKKLFRCHMTSKSFNANQIYMTAVKYTDALQLRKVKSNYYIADYDSSRIVEIVHALQRSVYDYLLESKKISVDEYKSKFEFDENLQVEFLQSSKTDKKQVAKQA